MHTPATYCIAVSFLVANHKLRAAAVIYPSTTEEPSFTYASHGRTHVSFLYRRGDRVPPALNSSLNDYIRSTAVSWAVVAAHPTCPPDVAMELSVVRAVERWVTRQHTFPRLTDTYLFLPTKKPLTLLPKDLKQVTGSKTWQVYAARALCRHSATQE